MSQNTIPVKLNKGGKSTVKVRSVITATRSKVTPFPRPTNAYCVLRRLFQKSSTKQGLKFKLSTNDLSSEKKDGKVVVVTESVKDGKQELVCVCVILKSLDCQRYLNQKFISLMRVLCSSPLAIGHNSKASTLKISASKSICVGAS